MWINRYWDDFYRDCPALSEACLEWLNGILAFVPNSNYFLYSHCEEIIARNEEAPFSNVALGLKQKLTNRLDPNFKQPEKVNYNELGSD
jgi:hypothetical protein